MSSSTAASGTVAASATQYSYTPNGALSSVTLPGGNVVGYTSDGANLRQSRTAAGITTAFTWATAGKLPLLLDDGAHTYIYGPSSSPIAQIDDSTHAVEYLHDDLIGTPKIITNAAGVVSGVNTYDPYGNQTAHTGTSASSIGYSGNWTDPATALVYLRARDYDPVTAQFLTVDPALDETHQPYAYVANNPLLVVDLLGLSGDVGTIAGWISAGAGVVGLALDGTILGAPLGALLEGVSLAAGAVAALDDCGGVFGGETNITVCGLDVASLATAGVGEIAAREAGTALKAADKAIDSGVKEYTAGVKSAQAASLKLAHERLNASSVGLATWSLDWHYGKSLNPATGGWNAESSIISC